MRAERIAGMALLVLLVLLPAVWMVGYAGFYSVGLLGLLRTGLTASWWWQACSGGVLLPSLLLSMTTAVVTTALCLVTGMLLCVAADHWRVERGVGVLLTLGAALPVSAVAFVVLQLCSRGGLLARGLAVWWPDFQPGDFPVLVNDVWSVGIVLAGWLTGVPLTGLFLLSVWRSAGLRRYVELAERLGAGAWRACVRGCTDAVASIPAAGFSAVGVEFFGLGGSVAAWSAVTAADVRADSAKFRAVFAAGPSAQFCLCDCVLRSAGLFAAVAAACSRRSVRRWEGS